MTYLNLMFAFAGDADNTLEIDIYDEIGASMWGAGVTAKDVREKLQVAPRARTIRLRVNSRGGDVFDGWAIYNLLRDHPARVEADVDGLAASMASVILMAADDVHVARGSMVMIHNPVALAYADEKAMRGMAEVLGKVRGEIAGAYSARTKLAQSRILDMMDAETWMTAEEAVSLGFADTVKHAESDPKALAAVGFEGLSHPPSRFAFAVADARTRLGLDATAAHMVGAERQFSELSGRKAGKPPRNLGRADREDQIMAHTERLLGGRDLGDQVADALLGPETPPKRPPASEDQIMDLVDRQLGAPRDVGDEIADILDASRPRGLR